MFWDWGFFDNSNDFFGVEFGFLNFLVDDAYGGVFTEWDFDNLARL